MEACFVPFRVRFGVSVWYYRFWVVHVHQIDHHLQNVETQIQTHLSSSRKNTSSRGYSLRQCRKIGVLQEHENGSKFTLKAIKPK